MVMCALNGVIGVDVIRVGLDKAGVGSQMGCAGRRLGDEPIDRDWYALRLRLIGILEQDLAPVRLGIIDLHDAGTGGFVSRIQYDDGLTGSEDHRWKIVIWTACAGRSYEQAVQTFYSFPRMSWPLSND